MCAGEETGAFEQTLAVVLGHWQVLRHHVDVLVVFERCVRRVDAKRKDRRQQRCQTITKCAEREPFLLSEPTGHGLDAPNAIRLSLILAEDAERRQAL